MMRGYVKGDCWYDKDDKPHRLSEMSDEYIENCGKLIGKRLEKHHAKKNKETLMKDEEFLKDFDSLIHLVREQEFRKSVKETATGRLLYE